MSGFGNKLLHWYFSKGALPYWTVLFLDCIFVLFSGYIGQYLLGGGLAVINYFWPMTYCLLGTALVFVFFFHLFHTYTGVVRYSTFSDLWRVALAVIMGSIASFALYMAYVHLLDGKAVLGNGAVYIVIALFSILLMWVERILIKLMYDSMRTKDSAIRVFIYGVKDGGVALAKTINNQMPPKYKLVGFVSPDGDLKTKFLMGVQVRKDGPHLIGYMKNAGAKVLMVSPLMEDRFRNSETLVNDLISNGIKIMTIPQATVWDGKSNLNQSQMQEVDIEDLLPRDQIQVDMDAIGALLTGHRILITGAAGSIGSEMVRQVATYKPAEMILVDQAETPMHDIRLLMAQQFADIPCETIVTSITNKEFMEKLFSDHRPEYVFHAAAYKHVPMMEDNPVMAIENNVYGTRVIADLAVKYGTHKFVMISTDKAVNPTNVMGCSKRICEIYCQALSKAIKDGDSSLKTVDGTAPVTQFVTTRFGNVLGSNGSVIPLFKEQIKKGGPITVTHPDIIRYFMLIPEACKLVLEAGVMGKGGEIFVFDMGKPVKIVALAQRMIALSGAKDIEIKFTGLRDGEKLYEEVLAEEEGSLPTVHPKIKVAKVREYEYATALENEQKLMEVAATMDPMKVVRMMQSIVPEYHTTNERYA